jgi:hypothetical protein
LVQEAGVIERTILLDRFPYEVRDTDL